MAHTLIQIQSYLFIISQLKVSFQFLIFKGAFLLWYLLLHTIIFIQSHILRLQMGSTTFKRDLHWSAPACKWKIIDEKEMKEKGKKWAGPRNPDMYAINTFTLYKLLAWSHHKFARKPKFWKVLFAYNYVINIYSSNKI